MKLHFLVSISSVTESLYGVRFLCSFLGSYSDCDVTLFHIHAPAQKKSSAVLQSMWDEPGVPSVATLDASASKALRTSRQLLQAGNININAVTAKTVREKYGKIRDILTEGANGLYDAIILGKRATYALQWMFERPADQTAQELIRHAALRSPLWNCNEPEEDREHVLLCLDGSESALRMADHVGYILSFVLHHHVTLFHVSSSRTSGSDKILDQGEAVLLSHNIARERIHKKAKTGAPAANAILKEEQNGRFAAVAVGLNRQTDKTMTHSVKSAGKTTSILLSKITKASFWCCP
ncbi:MAG: hypothetical protein ACWGOX_16290 [Desulforhopalus sp.]